MIRLVRGLVLSVGLAVLGVFGLTELLLRRRSAGTADLLEGDQNNDADLVTGSVHLPLSRTLARVRMVLAVVGVATAVYGAYLVVRTIPWTSYLAIAVWLGAAVILHDAVLVPAVSVLREATLRVGERRLSAAALAVIEGAFVVGGVVTLVAVPEIWAKHLGALNPTVLPGSYGTALVVTWLVVAAVTVCVVAVLAGRARRHTAVRAEPAR